MAQTKEARRRGVCPQPLLSCFKWASNRWCNILFIVRSAAGGMLPTMPYIAGSQSPRSAGDALERSKRSRVSFRLPLRGSWWCERNIWGRSENLRINFSESIIVSVLMSYFHFHYDRFDEFNDCNLRSGHCSTQYNGLRFHR